MLVHQRVSQLLANLPILGPDRLGAGARRLPPEAKGSWIQMGWSSFWAQTQWMKISIIDGKTRGKERWFPAIKLLKADLSHGSLLGLLVYLGYHHGDISPKGIHVTILPQASGSKMFNHELLRALINRKEKVSTKNQLVGDQASIVCFPNI
jgi:hypothetical protein